MKLAGKIGTATVIVALLSGVVATASHAAQHQPEAPLARAEALEKAAERFDAADADGNGVLSEAEARAAHADRGEGRPEGRPQGRPEGKGGAKPQRPAPEARGAFEPLSRADALAQAAERFDAADANGDGVLSADELRKGGRPPRQR